MFISSRRWLPVRLAWLPSIFQLSKLNIRSRVLFNIIQEHGTKNSEKLAVLNQIQNKWEIMSDNAIFTISFDDAIDLAVNISKRLKLDMT